MRASEVSMRQIFGGTRVVDGTRRIVANSTMRSSDSALDGAFFDATSEEAKYYEDTRRTTRRLKNEVISVESLRLFVCRHVLAAPLSNVEPRYRPVLCRVLPLSVERPPTAVADTVIMVVSLLVPLTLHTPLMFTIVINEEEFKY